MASVVDTLQQVTGRCRHFTCGVCETQLPIRLPEQEETARQWECRCCGAVYFGEFDHDSPVGLVKNVRECPRKRRTAKTDTIDNAVFRAHGNSRTACPDRERVLPSFETVCSRQLDRLTERPLLMHAEPKGAAFLDSTNRPDAMPYNPALQLELLHGYEQSAGQLESLMEAFCGGKPTALDSLPGISQQILSRAADDLDLYVCLGINPFQGGSSDRHSLHVAMLSMAVAAHMGWDRQTILDLGTGCLLHDAGMRRVKDSVHEQQRVLSTSAFAEIALHPIYTFELLESRLDVVPVTSRMVAYQMHERCNGTGYPRGCKANQIHDLAKISAVADVYIALVSSRPHRPGMMPYYAMERILQGVKSGLFASDVVRALLHTISLFPVGSYVSLNDGSIGKVLRANSEFFDCPIVEVFLPGNSFVIDLAQHDSLHVVAAAAGPT